MCIRDRLSTFGKVPFVSTFAAFATGRVYDQIRCSVAVSYTHLDVYKRQELGLDEVYTELLPNNKVEKVEELMKSKSKRCV